MASHAQVAHAWAHQTGKQRNGKNLFYQGPTIFSYGHHFAIARIVTVKGEQVVLFTTRRYSSSTGKHINIVSRAISHMKTLMVEDPTSSDHTGSYDMHIKAAEAAVKTAARARKWGDMHLADARRSLGHANALNEAFDMGHAPATLETLGVFIADLEARLAAAREAELARKAEQEREAFKRQAERRAAWLAGGYGYFHGSASDGTALIRAYEGELQTSQGASVPLSHAIRAFRFIKMARGTGWHANGHTLKVGHYEARAINEAGDLTIGCHTIRWSEIERVARELGVFDEPASDEALTSKQSLPADELEGL